MNHRDIAQIIVVTLLWSLCFPLINIGVEDAPPLFIGALRALVAGSVLLLVSKFQKRPWPSRKTLVAIAISGLGLTTMGFAGMFLSGGRVSPGLAGVLANIQPLLAALVGMVVLKEKIAVRSGFALALGFGGILLTAYATLFSGDGSTSTLGVAYILMGAVGVALGNVILNRVAGRIDAVVASGFALLVGAVPLSILSYSIGDLSNVHFSIPLVAVIGVLSLLGTALVSVLWLDLLKRNELIQINVYTFLTPVFGLSIAAFFLGERLGLLEWSGVVLVLIAVIVMSTATTSKKPDS